MPRNTEQQFPFWDFVNSFSAPGQGVDNHHEPCDFDFSFGGPSNRSRSGPAPRGPWGQWDSGAGLAGYFEPGAWGEPHHHQRRGGGLSRHGRRHGEFGTPSGSDEEKDDDERHARHDKDATEKEDSADTMNVEDAPDPEEVVIEDNGEESNKYGRGPVHRRGGCRRGHEGPRGGCGPWGRGGGGGGRAFRRGGLHGGPHGIYPGGPPHHAPPHHGSPQFGPPRHGHPRHRGNNFDLGDLMSGLTDHPFFQNFVNKNNNNNNNDAGRNENSAADGDTFTPPIDTFNTPTSYILHVALPGAKREDIAVNWDAERGILQITGIVHRPGDEDFLKTLATGERSIGMFERAIKLPPSCVDGAERDEVDGMGISAKIEDGILIITIPKLEREWTEIRKVDIE